LIFLHQKGNLKTLLLIILVILVVALFFVGWTISKYNVLPPETDITMQSGEVTSKEIIDTVQLSVAPKIISKLQGNPKEITILQTCLTKDNCTGTTSAPPFQWLRYAQYYHAKAYHEVISNTEVLDDLFAYNNNSFDMRLYQYGDIILDSKIADTKYKDRYLEITDNIIPQGYFSQDTTYNYYSKSNPLDVSVLAGSSISPGNNNGILVMSHSINAMTEANAYAMTKNKNYLNTLNILLDGVNMVSYFDGEATKAMSNAPKYSTCYSLLANAKAYSVTQDKIYLQQVNDLILGNENYLQKFFALSAEKIDLFNTNPMNILPCLDALNMLMSDDEGHKAIYADTFNAIIDFMVKNGIIDVSRDSDSFGIMQIANKQDINSTAWLIKILSEN
jgi:hypothetical protein